MIGFLGLCQLVGAASGAMTQQSVRTWYLTLVRPPGTPPNWVFAPVWTTLYLMIGLAAWLVWRTPRHQKSLRVWGWQLLFNALWTPAFFGLHMPPLAFVVALAMVVTTIQVIRSFVTVRSDAALLMVPYLAWVCYATYLTAGFWWLNPA